MSWVHTKHKNLFGEYEIKFGTKDGEKAKAVKKVCVAVVDRKVNHPEDVEVVTRCKDCRHWLCNDRENANTGVCGILVGLDFAMQANDFCSYGEKEV